jgi:hypothetical protein
MVLSIRQDTGRVIVMHAGCQQRFKHGMPPESRLQPKSFTLDPRYQCRINWTMRCVNRGASSSKRSKKRKVDEEKTSDEKKKIKLEIKLPGNTHSVPTTHTMADSDCVPSIPEVRIVYL